MAVEDELKTREQLIGELRALREQCAGYQAAEARRWQIEEALRASQERFRILFDCNDAACRMNGYTREELIGQDIHLLSPMPFDPGPRRHYLERIRQVGTVHSQSIHQRKDGTLVPVEFSTSLINPGDRQLLLSIDRDITERVRAEQELRESEERFRQLAENIHQVFWIADAATLRRLYVSPAYEVIWGRSRESLLEDPMSFLEAVHPADRERIRAAQAKQPLGEYNEEYRIVRPNGETRWIWARAFPIRNARGEVYRVAGMEEDITERKCAEEERLAFEQLKSEFMANISHDLRTPLHHIQGYAMLLLQRGRNFDEQTQQDFLQTIVNASDQLTHLIDDLLDTARLTSGALRLGLTSVRLDELVQSIVHRWQRISSHQFQAYIPLDVPEVRADPGRIGQVLDNLLINVVNHTPEGTPAEVAIDLTDEEVIVSVIDHGPGVPSEHLPYLFERFYQVEPHTDRQRRGSGLGLFICKWIVEHHGGRIWAEPTPGSGLTVRFSLPRSHTTQETD